MVILEIDEQLKKSYEEQKDDTITLTSKLNAGDFRSFTTNFMIDVNQYLQHLKQIPELLTKLNKNLENHNALMEEVKDIKKENAALKIKVDKLEREGTQKDEEVKKLTENLQTAKEGFNEELKQLTVQVKANAKAALALERHSRSFSLRIHNVPESKNEKFDESIQKVYGVFSDVTGRDDIKIEYGHRTGKHREDNSARPVIFRLLSRQDKMYLLTQRKKFHEAGYLLFEDLPKADVDEKAKHSKLMQEKYNAGKKVAFIRGQWFVDGHAFTG